MKVGDRGPLKTLIDREKLMELRTCPACGMKFNLGDPVVLACGDWGDPKLIHEGEAVFDPETRTYYERGCYLSKSRK